MISHIKTNESIKNYLIQYLQKLNLVFNIKYDIASKHLFPDIVHDLRVSSRRLLSFIEVAKIILGAKNKHILKLEKNLNNLLNSLSKLRDCQVQLIALDGYSYSLYMPKPFTKIINQIENQEVKNAKNIIKNFNIKGHYSLIETLVLDIYFIEQDDIDIVPAIKSVIKNSAKECVDLLEKADRNDLDSIHEFRLAFKKFRYLMEIASKLFEIKKSKLKILGEYQDILGAIQDIHQLQKRAKSFLKLKNADYYANGINGIIAFLDKNLESYIEKFIELKSDFIKLELALLDSENS